MIYRNANLNEIESIYNLQLEYHILTIREEDKSDGFVTTLFTREQLKELIEMENGLAIACDGDRVVAYAMATSWKYWSSWPLFQFMIRDLSSTEYLGYALTTENSYQYGPICIHREYRGSEVLPNLFEWSRLQMQKKYPVMITFINQINHRSLNAHNKKLGLDIIKAFEFNNNQYYELGYDTSRKTPGANITI